MAVPNKKRKIAPGVPGATAQYRTTYSRANGSLAEYAAMQESCD
jgi:hypothetical protein